MRKAPIALLNDFFSLTLWERARMRVPACVKRIVFFLVVRLRLTTRNGSQKLYIASCAPHPNPLPKGEGVFQHVLLTIVSAGLMFTVVGSMRAQTPQPQPTSTDALPQQEQQVNNVEQMLGPLNLTSDQAQQIRRIYADVREERQAANFRMRTAQRALTEAIQAPAPDEALIEQRSKELADAQSNTIRLRSLTEARILQVLTQEQRVKLRQLRAQTQRRNQQNPRGLDRDQNALRPNQTNAPLTPRQRRLMRQQQQQRPQ
jgi:Spy/CpxP family protein refolding chaperone